MKCKFSIVLMFLTLFAVKGYSQDEVKEGMSTAGDYSTYLETIVDSVQYLKDAWAGELSKIDDNYHDYSRLKAYTNQLLKFVKDKKREVKNLGSLGKSGDGAKTGYVQYLTSELELVTKYYEPYNRLNPQSTEKDFEALNADLKLGNEMEQGFQDKLNASKEVFEKDNGLDDSGGNE